MDKQNNNETPKEEIDLLLEQINKSFTPNPYKIDTTYEEDLCQWVTIIFQKSREGYDFVYLSNWSIDEGEVECLSEIELSPNVIELMNRNKREINRIGGM